MAAFIGGDVNRPSCTGHSDSHQDDEGRLLREEGRGLILRPLAFPGGRDSELDYGFIDPQRDVPIPCLVCDVAFDNPTTARSDFLKHILVEHKVVIGKHHLICSMRRYAAYWKQKVKALPWADIFVVIRNCQPSPDSAKDGESTGDSDYYFLSNLLPEDKELRQSLHLERLKVVIGVQERERRDSSFSRMCLFCSQVFADNRSALFGHMLEQHNFNIGHCDNVVFVGEFLDTLEGLLNNLQCLFCEKTFKDRPTLKDHMRKKQHRKLDPQNKTYDRFYVVNYLECGKTWREIANEGEDIEVVSTPPNEEERELTTASEEIAPLHCLFCDRVDDDWTHFQDHLKDGHRFVFSAQSPDVVPEMDFYHKVKAVNYIRRQVHFLRCPHCEAQSSTVEHLHRHMRETNHCRLPADEKLWNDSQYLFSTYENDSVLYYLEEIEDTSDDECTTSSCETSVLQQPLQQQQLDEDTPPTDAPITTTQANSFEGLLLGALLEDIEGD